MNTSSLRLPPDVEANFGGGGRFSGGGGGGGLVSSMILVSMGARITSTMRCASPVTSAHPSARCIATTTPMPAACLPGLRCCWPKSTRDLQGDGRVPCSEPASLSRCFSCSLVSRERPGRRRDRPAAVVRRPDSGDEHLGAVTRPG